MCLYSRRRFPKISLKKRIVYKVIIPNEDDSWFPPMVGKPAFKYGIVTNPLRPLCSKIKYSSFCIGEGYFHAFTTEHEAYILKMYLEEEPELRLLEKPVKYEVVRCTIPAFTFYFESHEEIAAKRLIVPKK